MSVVTLPKDHQNKHRLRAALRNIHESLAVQAEAVKSFRTNMSRLEARIKLLDGTLSKYSTKIGTVQQKCHHTKEVLPDALALATS